MPLYRCTARSKTCESLPKPIKPRQCKWKDWHKIEPGESCPWANYLLKKKGVRRAHVRFMVEEKGASRTFGEAPVEEKVDASPTRYLGQAEARAEIERLIKGKR